MIDTIRIVSSCALGIVPLVFSSMKEQGVALSGIIYTIIVGYCNQISPPVQQISYIGGNATFFCFVSIGSESPSDILWMLNNTAVEIFNDTSVVVDFNPDIAGGSGFITFTNLSAIYNSTQVRCILEFSSGSMTSSSSSLLLIVQGRMPHSNHVF